MNVLHLYAGNLYGGIETFLVTLARLRHLAPDMHPEFALCFRGRLWDELIAAGATVHDLGPVRLSRPWTLLRARRRLRRILAERRPDVAVTHSPWVHLAFAPTVRGAAVRLAHYAHNPPEAAARLDHWAARTPPDVVIANSRFTAAAVPEVFPGVRTEVVYLPVQPAFPTDRVVVRTAVRKELDTPDSAVVIVTACRLERWKGHTLLLDALGRLRDVPGWVSWIAGGAQRPHEVAYLSELKATAERLGIADRVRFLGQRADVPRLLVSADIHCQPNTGPEPFGIAFVEALAAGLPVVTTALGGAIEIVDETCGVLTKPGDAGAVAAAMGELVTNPVRRKALGSAGTARAAELCDPVRQLGRVAHVLLTLREPKPVPEPAFNRTGEV